MRKWETEHKCYFTQLLQLRLKSLDKIQKYLLKRIHRAFSHICNSSKVHHSIKFILQKYFINLITSQGGNLSWHSTSPHMFQSKLKDDNKIFLVTRKECKDTDFASPKSAYINWSLPGSGNKFWRTLMAPKFPRDRLSCQKEKIIMSVATTLISAFDFIKAIFHFINRHTTMVTR